MTRREAMRRRRQERQRRQQITIAAMIGVVAVAAAGWLIFQSLQAARPVDLSDITQVPTLDWTFANGKTLGPADARVVVQEFSDFQ